MDFSMFASNLTSVIYKYDKCFFCIFIWYRTIDITANNVSEIFIDVTVHFYRCLYLLIYIRFLSVDLYKMFLSEISIYIFL
jgi:hypothetical protein